MEAHPVHANLVGGLMFRPAFGAAVPVPGSFAKFLAVQNVHNYNAVTTTPFWY
jgi:hypothetical protein